MSDLHQAVRGLARDTVRTLIAEGVDVNVLDGMSRSALHLAAWKGDAELVQLLLRAKASTAQKARDNFSALHFACQSGSLECCRLLVAKNPKLLHESISKGKKKPLHLAAAKNNYEICQFLLQEGADPSALTSSGQTALDFAKDEKVFQLIKSSIAAKIDEESGGKGDNAVVGKRKAEHEDPPQVTTEETTEAAAGTSNTDTLSAAVSSNSPVMPSLSVEKGLGDSAGRGAKAVVVRRAKKQKVSKKIMSMSCYDDDDAEED